MIHNPREHQARRLRTWAAEADIEKPDATTTDPTIRKLYGPKGETLRTFSDRPRIGFRTEGDQ